MHETKMAKFIRGLVKFIFIACYIAFMWASIHHVATFFNNFESGKGDMFGSYLLAGAFDVTALVTTTGVMFFRKSMPTYIQIIVWLFILAIAFYSFLINWEYSEHFQSLDLTLQPTGEMTAVSVNGTIKYVPVMVQNTTLLFVNPLLASGFTIFSLIYSVVAEFFGTKPPTIEELKERQAYLQDTELVLQDIKELENKKKGKSFIQSTKEKAIELKSAVDEVKKKTEIFEETDPKIAGQFADLSDESSQTQEEQVKSKLQTGPWKTTQILADLTEENRQTQEEQVKSKLIVNSQTQDRHEADMMKETDPEIAGQFADLTENTMETQDKPNRGKGSKNIEEFDRENMPSWLLEGGSTVSIFTVVSHTQITKLKLRNRIEKGEIRSTKNRDIVYKSSLISWMKKEGILNESVLLTPRPETDTTEESSQTQEEKAKSKGRNLTEENDRPEADTNEESTQTQEEQLVNPCEETDSEMSRQFPRFIDDFDDEMVTPFPETAILSFSSAV